MNEEEIEERYKRLWKEEPRKFAIITCLGWYGSTNLKKISALIGKPETTTLRYIKQLIEEGLIEVDAEQTATKWGKYYKLVEEVEELYKRSIKEYIEEGSEFDKRIKKLKEMKEEEIKEEIIEKLRKEESGKLQAEAFKDYLLFIQNIESSIVNEWINLEREVKKGKEREKWKEKALMKTETALIVRTIEVTKIAQVIKIIEKVRQFVKEIATLQEEFRKENEGVKEKEKSIQFISIFLGGLSKRE